MINALKEMLEPARVPDKRWFYLFFFGLALGATQLHRAAPYTDGQSLSVTLREQAVSTLKTKFLNIYNTS